VDDERAHVDFGGNENENKNEGENEKAIENPGIVPGRVQADFMISMSLETRKRNPGDDLTIDNKGRY